MSVNKISGRWYDHYQTLLLVTVDEPRTSMWRLLGALLGQGRRGSEGPGGLGSGEKEEAGKSSSEERRGEEWA